MTANEDHEFMTEDAESDECMICGAPGSHADRASIGPDSERIREVPPIPDDHDSRLQASLEYDRGRVHVAAAIEDGTLQLYVDENGHESEQEQPLRAAGLLPGPDDIVVSRELAEALVSYDECDLDHHGGCQAHSYLSLQPGEICPQQELKDRLAALSQPHPAQEQQT